MKKLAIIGFSFVLLIIATLSFWHYQNHPSDSAIRQKLLGTWDEKIFR